MQKQKAFTLIEILIVIAIIGILAAVVLVSLNSSRDKSKYAKAEQEMAQFAKAMEMAQIMTRKPLREITGSNHSAGPCFASSGKYLKDIPDTDPCYTSWVSAITKLGVAAGTDLSDLKRDPWGSPYMLDENEGEFSTNPCRLDKVFTAGPDGWVSSLSTDIENYELTKHYNSDNKAMTITGVSAECN
ncbi:MAG: hypothetical protein QG620_561 [Patescibacteria group bacterium]|nr:hypothetical protein [Patescibacteria group bacterium]